MNNENDNILWIDIESTGLELHKERIITISFIFNDKVKTITVNPGKPITNSWIHGIYDKDVQNCNTFQYYAPQIFELCNRAECYAGYNLRSYDIVLLKIEMLRCGFEIPNLPIVDVYETAQSLFKSLKLKDLYLTLAGKTFNAHNSADDIYATKELFEIIKNKYLN